MPLYVQDYTEKHNDNITGHDTKQSNDPISLELLSLREAISEIK